MTPPLTPAPTKPRRFWLFAPFALAAAAAMAWSGLWVWERGEVLAGMDAAKARSVGYQVGWSRRAVSGFPFRLDVDMTDARLSEETGWAVRAPVLKAEAFVFAPTHWVAFAPSGVVLSRPRGGPVTVRASALRASLSDASGHPPRLSVEGLDLKFETHAGAGPFLLSDAKAFHFHAKSGPSDQGGAYIEFDRALARGTGGLAALADGRPFTLIADLIYSHAAAVGGRNAGAALRAWSATGGGVTVRRLYLQAGHLVLEARAGALAAGPDGRLRGSLMLSVRDAPRVLAVLGATGVVPSDAVRAAAMVLGANQADGAARIALDFQAGRTTLGPVALGPAPRAF